MNKTMIAACVPTLIFAGLFGMERMQHQATQARIGQLEAAAVASDRKAADYAAERNNLRDQLEQLRTSHNDYVAKAKAELEKAKLAGEIAAAKLAANVPKPAVKTPTASVEAADPAQSVIRSIAGLLSQRANSPDHQERMRQQATDRIKRRYADLFAKLNLSPENQASLTALLVDREMHKRGSGMRLLQAAGSPDGADAAIADLVGETSAADQAIQDFLGDEGYKQFTHYEDTASQRRTVNKLTQALADSPEPLSPDQADKLVDLLYDTQTAVKSEAVKDFVHRNDQGGTVISLDSGQLQEQTKARNDLVLNQVKDQELLSETQQQALAGELNKEAQNPFGAMLSEGLDFGGGGIQIKMIGVDAGTSIIAD